MKTKREQFFYLEFSVAEDASFEFLQRFFEALQDCKSRFDAAQGENEDELINDPIWVSRLNETALDYFGSANLNKEAYCFDSLLSMIFQSEYTLISIERESPQNAVLFYDPWADPFGSVAALQAMIESFGHRITYNSFWDSFKS